MKVTPKYMVNALVLLGFALLAFVPWQSFYSETIALGDMLAAPSLRHPWGTDNLGRDLLVRMSAVTTQAVLPVWLAVIVATCVGLVLGGGLVLVPSVGLRETVRGLAGVCVGIPIGLLVFCVAVTTEVIGITSLVVPLALVFGLRSVHFVFESFDRDYLLGYWQANVAIGSSPLYRVVCYGFGQAWTRDLLQMIGFNLRVALIAEVGLSYLGFGIQEPQASFGNILASHFDAYLNGQFHVLLVVTGCMWFVSSVPAHGMALIIGMRTGRIGALTVDQSPPSTCKTSPVM